MSGWKQWAALEEVLATDFQSYLQDQVVQVYAGTAARGSALGTAVSAGMVSYLEDSGVLQFYNGTAWANVSQIGDITAVTAGTGLTGGGSSGDVTLDVNYAAVGSAVLASPNITGTATIAAGSVTGDLVVGGNLSDPNWTAARVLTTSGSTAVTSTVTTTELGYLSGVTSAIQTQLNSKAGTSTPTFNQFITVTGANPALELKSSTGSFGYIDFSDNSGDDYDVRLRQVPAARRLILEDSIDNGDKSVRNIYTSTSAPSGGADGDVWLQYTP